ncbi:hypothetical protein DV453_004638 [Geotrichum candidum]|nr:hypothetical protein DV453_004638 [Geotrichum candidum]
MDLVNHLTDRLLFAVPKTIDLLKGADIQFRRSHRLDIALSTNMPIALVFLPAADIPRFVGEGRCTLGITGADQVAESGVDVEETLNLNFGNCKLQVQVPENGPFSDPKELIGKTIVTSFTKLADDYFRKLENKQPGEKLDTFIKFVGGSVEAAIALGVGDAIVDLVESGETMRAAGLKPIGTVMSTSATLITSKQPAFKETLDIVTARISGVLAAKKFVLCTYNAPRSNLEKLLSITPGRRAPTITSLDEEDWVAVSSMVERKNHAAVMDQLTAAGAADIIIFQISNCRV